MPRRSSHVDSSPAVPASQSKRSHDHHRPPYEPIGRYGAIERAGNLSATCSVKSCMRKSALSAGVLALAALTACTHAGRSTAATATRSSSTTTARLSAQEQCRRLLPGRAVVKATWLSAEGVTSLRTAELAPGATRTSIVGEDAVWCWTGRPNDWTGYAIGLRSSRVLFTQGLGPEYSSVPGPGPNPIP